MLREHRVTLAVLFAFVGFGSIACHAESAPGVPKMSSPVEGTAVADARSQTEADSPTPFSTQPGVVLSRQEIDVRPPTSARVLEVSVHPGQRVAAGDVLARLDTREAEADLRVAKADLRALRAERKALRLSLDAAQRERETTAGLHERGVLSQHEADEAALKQGQARAALAGVDARIHGLEAQVAQVRADIQERELRAPIDGVVAGVPVAEGERVDPVTVVVRLVAADGMRVRFAVDPSARGEWRPGQPLQVRDPERVTDHPATVRSVAPEIDPAAHQVFVDATLDDPTTALLVGLAVWVEPRG